MSSITRVGRVMVPVADQDAAIAFYTGVLGFELTADTPFGDGERWVEVTPPGGEAALALIPPRGSYKTGMTTGVALETPTRGPSTRSLRQAGLTSILS